MDKKNNYLEKKKLKNEQNEKTLSQRFIDLNDIKNYKSTKNSPFLCVFQLFIFVLI
jgi:hypothetical protein